MFWAAQLTNRETEPITFFFFFFSVVVVFSILTGQFWDLILRDTDT